MNAELRRALEQVAARSRKVRLLGALALAWLALAIVGFGLTIVTARPSPEPGLVPLLLGWLAALAVVTVAVAIPIYRSKTDPQALARRIEARYPDLDTGLLAAVEQVYGSPDGPTGFLQAEVVRVALAHRRDHDWDEAVPSARVRLARLANGLSVALLALTTAFLFVQAKFPDRIDSKLRAEGSSPESPVDLKVEPGDAEVERGTSLLVVARFGGANVPVDAKLVVLGSEKPTTRKMARSLEDPTFAARVESVESDLAYRVDFAGKSSPTYKVKVFEYPEVRRVDARLDFPEYTTMETKVVEDVRHVTAVEGTELTLSFRLNKPVASAKLVDEKGVEAPLKADSEGSDLYAASFTLADSHRYKVQLVDREGRSSKVPAEVAVNVTRNKPATVVMTQPSRDVRVSPVEELTLRAKADDDFGVVRVGMSYALGGDEPKEIDVPGGKPGARHVNAEHLLAFEAMNAQPDQLVTYFFWAEDVGPDGKPRRTMGDMFFAEVRHFEEIFRQGEQQSASEQDQQDQQQQNGAAEQADQLVDLQKQIINATWKLVRRETRATPTPEFAADAGTIRDSQASAIEKAGALGQLLTTPTGKADFDRALKAMNDAEKHLATASNDKAIKELAPALAAEQAAYQALLKLRAREFQVQRNNRQQRSQSSASSSQQQRQQQLNELELSNEENRYEQRQAARNQTQQEQQQQEDRQVVNRLKELSQRQADLNARVKELQAALEAAKDQQAREEIERQLKRLRDQQEQILRDTDELQERMEREENRERMADDRQRLEQAREEVRQASEALGQNKLSQAVNEGTRAQRQMNDLREEIRKKSSDRFVDEMTEMRQQARQLDETQAQLARQIEARDKQQKGRPTLRDEGDKKAVAEGLDRQQKDLETLLDRMRTTVQDAEETQPLLAKQLFDAVRQANEQAIPKSLRETNQLAEVGINDEAAKSARRAGQGLTQLREGVEKAAQGVLGDGTEALKRAQAELDDLSNQLNREIARADTPQPGERPDGQRARGQQGEPGQPGGQNQTQPGERDGQRPGEAGAEGQQPGQREGQQPGEQGHTGRQRGQQGQQGQPGEGQQGQRGQQGQGQEGQQGQGQQGQGQQGQGQQGQGQQGQGQRGQQGQQRQGQQGQGQQRQGQQRQGQLGQEGQQGQGQQGQQGQGQQGQGQGQGQGQQGQGQGQAQQGQGQQGQQGQNGQGQRGQGQRQQEPGQGQQGQGQQGQEGQQGQGQGQQGQGQQGQGQQGQGQPGQGGQRPGGQGQRGGMRQAGGATGGGGNAPMGGEQVRNGPGNPGPGGPITGDGFRQWSDRMRDVEELLDDPQLRADAARIRDRARGAREEFKRHSQEPDPAKLKEMVADPLRELRDRVAEEVRRREKPDSLVPIDRDPVPPQYAEGVRRYYERLGTGR